MKLDKEIRIMEERSWLRSWETVLIFLKTIEWMDKKANNWLENHQLHD